MSAPGRAMSSPNATVMQTLAWLRQTTPAVFAQRRDLQLDSRNVKRGDVFVAVPGWQGDGRAYVGSAVQAGAAAALVDADGWQRVEIGIPVCPVAQLRTLVGPLAAAFYGHPSASLLSVGVTGTNGKTSCSHWIAQLLTRAGRRCAVIGTVGTGLIDEPLTQSVLTTPDPVSLQREVRGLLEAGAQALAMEVSSIGLDQGRVAGMKYDVALYTNLTRDHLDYHGTMARYESCKALLFDWPTLSHAVLNIDDAACRRLLPRLADRGVRVIGFTLEDASDPALVHRLTAEALRATDSGLAFRVALDGEAAEVEVPLAGHFNVANLLGVLGVTLACGIDFRRAVDALPQLVPPPGRMQRVVQPGAPLAVIDYAHTPDALTQALSALRPLAEARGGRLWAVFGAGGDRDPGKRLPMGAAAAAGADRLVITSDNPRSEDPAAIVAAIAAGASAASHTCIVDRQQAIEHALHHAASADVVLIAGKGHEDYQIVGTLRRPFSDIAIARTALVERGRR